MGMFLFLTGILLFIVGLIILIINFFKKKPKKNLVIVMLVGVIFFIIGTIIAPNYNTNNEESTEATSDSDNQKSEEEQYFDTIVSKLTRIDSSNYDSNSYELIDYKKILRYPEEYFDKKAFLFALKVFQINEVGNYTQFLAMDPYNYDNIYMVFIENNRLEKKILKNDEITIYGQLAAPYKYITQNNQENEVPLVYINSYGLKE